MFAHRKYRENTNKWKMSFHLIHLVISDPRNSNWLSSFVILLNFLKNLWTFHVIPSGKQKTFPSLVSKILCFWKKFSINIRIVFPFSLLQPDDDEKDDKRDKGKFIWKIWFLFFLRSFYFKNLYLNFLLFYNSNFVMGCWSFWPHKETLPHQKKFLWLVIWSDLGELAWLRTF